MRALLLAPVWLWLLVFVAAPAAILVAIALAVPAASVPPFRLGWGPGGLAELLDGHYVSAFGRSLATAGAAAMICLLIGYSMALAIARSRRRRLLLLLVMLPFWSGVLLRLVAWIGILRDEGVLNGLLRALHLVSQPLPLLHTDAAMLVGLVYCYLPFLVLPVAARLAVADRGYERAAADLGAAPWAVFRRVTWPMSDDGMSLWWHRFRNLTPRSRQSHSKQWRDHHGQQRHRQCRRLRPVSGLEEFVPDHPPHRQR